MTKKFLAIKRAPLTGHDVKDNTVPDHIAAYEDDGRFLLYHCGHQWMTYPDADAVSIGTMDRLDQLKSSMEFRSDLSGVYPRWTKEEIQHMVDNPLVEEPLELNPYPPLYWAISVLVMACILIYNFVF